MENIKAVVPKEATAQKNKYEDCDNLECSVKRIKRIKRIKRMILTPLMMMISALKLINIIH